MFVLNHHHNKLMTCMIQTAYQLRFVSHAGIYARVADMSQHDFMTYRVTDCGMVQIVVHLCRARTQ